MSTQTAKASRLREYEVIYVLAPNADHQEAERLNAKVTEVVQSFGGKMTKLDNWGRRKLAYPIQKNSRGIFVHAKYIALPGVVAEIERNLRIADSVLRFQSALIGDVADPQVAVDPEDLKFVPVAPAEPEEEINIEQRLGLVPSARRRPASLEEEGMDADLDEGMDEQGGEDAAAGGDR